MKTKHLVNLVLESEINARDLLSMITETESLFFSIIPQSRYAQRHSKDYDAKLASYTSSISATLKPSLEAWSRKITSQTLTPQEARSILDWYHSAIPLWEWISEIDPKFERSMSVIRSLYLRLV